MSDEWQEFDATFDEADWDWLYEMHPEIAEDVHKMVQKGKSPDEIKKRIIRRQGRSREDLAKRCENAARHLAGLKR